MPTNRTDHPPRPSRAGASAAARPVSRNSRRAFISDSPRHRCLAPCYGEPMSRKAWPIAVALAWLAGLPARAQEAPAEVSVGETAEADPAVATPTAESV